MKMSTTLTSELFMINTAKSTDFNLLYIVMTMKRLKVKNILMKENW